MRLEAIITGDWHLRNDVPICRPETQEEWIDLQFSKVRQIFEYAINHDLPILHTGDLFHRSQPYYGVVGRFNELCKELKPEFYKLAGNHDLPYHNFDNVLNSGWYSAYGEDIKDFYGGAFHFGTKPTRLKAEIVFTHQLIFKTEKELPPMIDGKTAKDLLNEFSKAKYIFTGDNHKTFHYEKNDRHVINPGCLLRQSATEEDYNTGFYIVNTDTNKFDFHSIGDDCLLNTNHLQKTKERDERIEAFISKVQASGQVSFNFTENLNAKLLNKKIAQGIKDIVIEIKEEIA